MKQNRAIIEAKNLFKKYRNTIAVNGIDFKIFRGECFGFLGPNGAGKTTTVKMICCFSPVTSGELNIMEMDVHNYEREIKANLGIVPQENNLDLDLTVEENLLVYAGYFDIPKKKALQKAAELLNFFALTEKKDTRADKLSGGMKRRLIIARALINDPGLLILDEPTTGLDPAARQLVWRQLIELKERGITLLLTTHYLEEADRLCDRIMIMNNGNILESGAPRELVSKFVGTEVLEIGISPEQKDYILNLCRKEIYEYLDFQERLLLFPRDGQKLLSALQNKQLNLHYQFLRPANLEDVFFKLTGKGLEE